MKNLKKIREEHGAGEWGTPELTKKYQDETPGQTVKEAKFKVTFMHKHPEGQKQHDYVVSAPHQNAADKKAIEMHRKAHPSGDFHMWNSEELYEEGLKDACWKGYEAIGTKMKNGKRVPNCVPKEGHTEDAQAAHQAAHAALKKGDVDTYHQEMDKKFAAHQAGEKEAAKKPVKTFEATEFKPNEGVLAQIKKDHEELKNKSTKEVLAVHQGQHRVRSNYTAAEIGGKHAMIGDILRNRHGSKHVDHFYSQKEDTDGKNLKITKHEKMAVEAEKRGDKQAQQYHLNIVSKLKNESTAVNEETAQTHRVDVMMDDPKKGEIVRGVYQTHKAKLLKRVHVQANDPKEAEAKAHAHFTKQGFNVHTSTHHSVVQENVEIAEAAGDEKTQKHLVTVTVTDPQHAMATKRKEKIMKRVKVSAKDPKDAVAKAEAHYKKHGFKVHDSLHHSVVQESLDTDEIVDATEEPSNDQQLLSMARGQLSEIADMAKELVDSMDETDDLEPWMNAKITTAYVNLDDVHSFIAYGDEYSTDNNSKKEKGELGEAVGEIDSEEKAQIAKMQTLIRLGMLNIAELPIALRVMKRLATDQQINVVEDRKMLLKLLTELIELVTEDDMVFRRVKMNVQKS
jgi:hypothetical protein